MGYATDSSNQQIVQQAIATTTTASSVTASSNTTQPNAPNTSAETATAPKVSGASNTAQLIGPNSSAETVTLERGLSWLWLLLLGIPLLGGLIWWLLKDRQAPLSSSADTTVAATIPATAAGTATAAPSPSHSLLFLVPYDGKNAYAYWQIAPAQIEQLQRRGGEKLMLRLYDITDIPDPDRQISRSLKQFDCQAQERYLLINLPAENRDYMVELGYLTQVGNWLPLTRSGMVRVAASVPTGDVVLAMMLRDSKNVYAYWEIPPVAIEALKHQGWRS